ncbi:MAG: NUDIX pyrophosphatase [Candidatus Magasanikbacteria bacterium]|jgi:dihydroneopterin triphosphate diphosphatase|nr:NUDIX pyrophosphatase [Candidatus Magasanikbacteria bacterium]MBT4071734.1 NUDIX pyrophosphatase [Candidatus Magasanikbacteria bacterium]
MNTHIAQVEIIVYKIVNAEPQFLLLKRVPERGSFWQPVTGGVHKNEDLLSAAKRELFEETQIKDYINFLNDVHYFEFHDDEQGMLKEYVYGVEVNEKIDVKLSLEHSEKKWCTINEALELLKFDTNKDAFKKLYKLLTIKD